MGHGTLRPLVLCYGNRLRRDDGVAWHVAERLTADGRLAGADLRCCHQLTPELAEDLSHAGRVVFVDACVGPTPGSVQRATVTPGAEPGGAPWSHGLTPASLAALCAAVFGRVPPMEVVTVAAATTGVGEQLSGPVTAAVASAADAVVAAVSGPETEGPDDAGTFGPVIVTIASPSFPTGRASLQEGPEG